MNLRSSKVALIGRGMEGNVEKVATHLKSSGITKIETFGWSEAAKKQKEDFV